MKLTVLFLIFIIPSAAFAQTLKITITGMRNNSGNVWLGFYNNDESFQKEQPLFVKTESKAIAVNGVLVVTCKDIKPGTYGIALMDDENSNNKMDYGWFLPKEGFGFSNYYHTGMTKPSFNKFSFILKEDSKPVEIKVRYL